LENTEIEFRIRMQQDPASLVNILPFMVILHYD
jgi:hypothetical protein